jgi:Zn-dependent M16 (insulinase) family peptidase
VDRTTAPPKHHAFEIVNDEFVEEYGTRAIVYKHKKSGAQFLSVIAPDENKVFGITFRTPPDDSTGVPHVLEHSVLCGSRKYPVKEPFAYLLKGSLNTFLNAFTYPDRTCYPVASQNTKDFYNLINVYLDAVLHPRAIKDPQVLEQEGWHYELDDTTGKVIYKGVVYNEMKGVYSSADSLMSRSTMHALFPDNTYGVDSGGDPREIPNLTFEQFRDFHARYYHPSNARVYFYGDDDPYKRLEVMCHNLGEYCIAYSVGVPRGSCWMNTFPSSQRLNQRLIHP